MPTSPTTFFCPSCYSQRPLAGAVASFRLSVGECYICKSCHDACERRDKIRSEFASYTERCEDRQIERALNSEVSQ